MASVSAKTATPLPVAPPTTAEALASFSEDIARAIMTSSSPKPTTKLHPIFDDELPPAPPPSPVSFAVDSNGKTDRQKREKIPSMSLE